MKQIKKMLPRLGGYGLVLLTAVSFYAVAASAGSQEDPLVTLSYLNGPFKQEVLAQVGSGGASATYSVVTLSNGQTLNCGAGCEVLLRTGTAVCVAGTDPGLIDTTQAKGLDGGSSLAANHLYIVSEGGKGVKATAASVTLLVQGSYTVS